MSVKSVTHLNFRGDARAALEFYQAVFGGDLAVVTYKDAGHVPDPLYGMLRDRFGVVWVLDVGTHL